MKIIYLIGMALILASCAAMDANNREAVSTFTPTSGITWQMRATTDLSIDKTDHQRWIAQYLKLNHMCPDGYTVTNERDVLVRHAMFSDVKEIIYTGRCNP